MSINAFSIGRDSGVEGCRSWDYGGVWKYILSDVDSRISQDVALNLIFLSPCGLSH
jgi:hypothetical protein